MSNARRRLHAEKVSWFGAAALTFFQILVVIAQYPDEPGRAYLALCSWDCGWYASIVEHGYHSVIPPAPQAPSLSNVAFFPAFPLTARLLHLALGLRPPIALLIVAQFFAFLFWFALVRLLLHWRIPGITVILVAFSVISHPAAFYLVAGYSESMFLSSLLLFLLFANAPAGAHYFRAALSGALMSATRILGSPVAAMPLLARRRGRTRRLRQAIILSLFAASGALWFFVYCWWSFGRFDLYMETQRIGWGVQPDLGAIFKWSSFQYRSEIDRIATLISGGLFLVMGVAESVLALSKKSSDFRRRLPAYFAALSCFALTLSSLRSVQFQSIIRYSLPWYLLLLACAAHLHSKLVARGSPLGLAACLIISLGNLFLLAMVQIPRLRDFLEGRWFA